MSETVYKREREGGEREGERDRQTDRQAGRQAETETERHIETETKRQRQTERQRKAEIKTDTERGGEGKHRQTQGDRERDRDRDRERQRDRERDFRVIAIARIGHLRTSFSIVTPIHFRQFLVTFRLRVRVTRFLLYSFLFLVVAYIITTGCLPFLPYYY